MKKILIYAFYCLIFLLLQSCAGIKQKKLARGLDQSLNNGLFANHFTGVLVIDPITRDTIYDHNSGKYLTPASNTKIFTLFAGLKLLPDSIPALKYLTRNDTLFIEGTGDPSALHPFFKDSTILKFIKRYANIALYQGNFDDTFWGPGWAWEDYDGAYAPERNALPLYGNIVQLYRKDSLGVSPEYFRNRVKSIPFPKNREPLSNTFYFDPGRLDTLYIPFRTDSILTRNLLEAASGRKILSATSMPEGMKRTIYSQPSDSLYKRMMQESDNFIAEQLLIVASSTLSDTLNGNHAREYLLDEYLKTLPQQPVWVDGSGLSRYNLFTPASIVHVLYQMYREVETDRLLGLFAAGGVSGTLKSWYAGDEEPYVFAKTGTLSNNHCVSGYLKARSGKLLIFSFMNNHFNLPSYKIKEQMQLIFKNLRDTY